MSKATPKQETEQIKHVAFIMDGNGRWAKKRGMPREYGHRFGIKAFRTILDHCRKLELETVTFYAFSTENWKRPPREVNALMHLMDQYFEECEKNIESYDFRIRFLGDRGVFDDKRRARMDALEQKSEGRVRTLNVALNYGGRAEIVNACNRLIRAGAREVSEADLAAALYTAHSDDPDLIIRTGGDLRISNFLLWQAAYAELYFTDVLWPDFTPACLDAAIADFHTRKRRYGGV